MRMKVPISRKSYSPGSAVTESLLCTVVVQGHSPSSPGGRTCNVGYGTAWCGMVWHGVVLYGMVWCGMVWYGMVWYGMVWYGMVWYGMVYMGGRREI